MAVLMVVLKVGLMAQWLVERLGVMLVNLKVVKWA